MKKKIGFSNFGFSTILLSFVMICVVTFFALSLTSAYADYKLSQKVADKNTAYYHAQQKAYEKLASLDALAQDTYRAASDESTYFSAMADASASYGQVIEEPAYLSVTFAEPIAEDHFLQVTFQICYPQADSDVFIKVLEWKSYYEKEPPVDDVLDLIQ